MKHSYFYRDCIHPQTQQVYPDGTWTCVFATVQSCQNGQWHNTGLNCDIPPYYPVFQKNLCCQYWDGRGYRYRCAVNSCPLWGPDNSVFNQAWEVLNCDDCHA